MWSEGMLPVETEKSGLTELAAMGSNACHQGINKPKIKHKNPLFSLLDNLSKLMLYCTSLS